MLACLIGTGCRQNAPAPEQRLEAAATVYHSTMRSLIVARKAGQISDSQYRAIEPFRALARDYLNKAEEAAGKGEDLDVGGYLDLFERALEKWAEAQQNNEVHRGD